METDRTAKLGLEADLLGVPCPPQLNRWLETLPDDLLSILETFVNDGHGVWLVGGCVRDAWLGEDAQDIDLCTSCPPERMLALFGDQAIATGVEFGTVTLKGTSTLYEATTLRTESLYRDGRRPEHVAWGSSLKEDLSRRDFTFNSMAIDVARRLLYDPYDGVTDMEQRVVRAVGDAGLRCREDALRILRAYRFLNRDQGPLWAMELRLQNAVREHRERLKMVAVERHWMELEKILTTPLSGRVLAKMNEDGVFETVFGEGQRPRNSLLLLNDLPTLASLTLHERLALMMAEWPTKSVVHQLKALKLPKALLRNTAVFHERLAHLPRPRQAELRVFAHVLEESAAAHLEIRKSLNHVAAMIHGKPTHNEELEAVLTAWENLPVRKSPENCLVDGHWIMARTGVEQGLRLGRLKDWLHRIQIEEDLTSADQMEHALSRLPFTHGDHNLWPKVSFPS